MNNRVVLLLLGIVASVSAQGYVSGDSYEQFSHEHNPRWQMTGSNGRVGSWGNDATFNPFCYNGCKLDVDATFELDVNADTNQGYASIRFSATDFPLTNATDPSGRWPEAPGYLSVSGDFEIRYTTFMQSNDADIFMEGGVADNVWLHGKSMPTVPLSKAFLGMWGPAKLYVNGTDMFPNMPSIGHAMLVPRVYDPVTFQVALDCDKNPGEYWSMMAGAMDSDNLLGCNDRSDDAKPDEFHFNFRPAMSELNPDQEVNSFMPMAQPYWIHLVFHDITDNSAPVAADSPPSNAWGVVLVAVGSIAVLGAAAFLVHAMRSAGTAASGTSAV